MMRTHLLPKADVVTPLLLRHIVALSQYSLYENDTPTDRQKQNKKTLLNEQENSFAR